LLPKIPKLEEMILIDIHIGNYVHSPFFMLKSLDLDLRLKKPLGTIYSYGRTVMDQAVKGMAKARKMRKKWLTLGTLSRMR